MKVRITESDLGINMLDLMNQLANMPGFTIYSELMSLNTSIYILDKNFEELEKFVTELTTNPKYQHVFMVENRATLHDISRDIVRRIHNFVSSALSLREHTLAMYNRYYREYALMPEYEERAKDVFGTDPLAQFIMSLRRYCQHYRSPHMSFRTAWQDVDNSPVHTAIISRDDLRSFNDWNSHAKRFIDDCGEGVDIVNVTRLYREKILSFYDWFQKEQGRIHKEDLESFRNKEAELILLQIRHRLRFMLEHPDDIGCSEQSLFFQIFLKSDFDELVNIDPRSESRVERAIELLNGRFKVPEDIQAGIRKVYNLPTFRFVNKPSESNEI